MRRTPTSFVLGCLLAVTLAPAVSAAAATVDPDLGAARAGLAAYLRDHRPATPSTSTDLPGCPALEQRRFEDALGAAGVTDSSLGDWSTEIEWGEWEDVDPELMGIVCAGDADGDAHDSDERLAAGISFIDAGSDERALEVEQQLGFGTLDAEPADVPGGELMATCIDDEGLSLCLAVWSSDGFVVATVVSSTEQAVPEGSASRVLADVLDDALATLAAYESSGAAPPSSAAPEAEPEAEAEPTEQSAPPAAGLDVEAARAGLAARLGEMDQISALEPLDDCAVAERDAVVDALAVSGIDAPIDALLAEEGPRLTNGTTWQATGLICVGSYVGAEDDPSFPELEVSVVVADFGDTDGFLALLAAVHPDLDVGDELPVPALGSGTVGQCEHVDRTDQCAEYWEHDGFVVGVQIVDRVYVDRPTASAVLGALVPVIVTSLQAEPAATSSADVTVPRDVIDAARERVAELSDDVFAECPFLDAAAIDGELAAAGIPIAPGPDWGGAPASDSDGAVAGIACAGDDGSSQVTIEVVDFADPDAADDAIGLVSGCQRGSNIVWCVEGWSQDGLTVTVVIEADAADVDRSAVRALVDTLAPMILTTLAAD